MISNFLQGEYKLRKQDYAVDVDNLEFLSTLNKILKREEVKGYRDLKVEKPFLFVLGTPRSGTTLLMQLLCNCLDIGCIDNIAARFWLAPLTGIRLSKAILKGKKDTQYKSDFGTGDRLSDPHEFAYFWQHWFMLRKEEDFYRTGSQIGEIDWRGFYQVMVNMQSEFGKPIAMKGLHPVTYIEKIEEVLGDVLWIYIDRDPNDVCWSILNTRIKQYGNPNKWLGPYPPNYLELAQSLPKEQIAYQVSSLRELYNRKIELSQSTVIRVHYAELCNNPSSIVEKVGRKSNSNVVNTPPLRFVFRTCSDRFEESNADT